MGYIYHGSTISNLKVIEPHSSTQAGSYVYGSPNYLVAVIFSIIQKTDKPFPLKFGWDKDENFYLAERFPHQFDSISNISSSIYTLSENDFKAFSNHSAGNNIELRTDKVQMVLKEDKIENALEYLRQHKVCLYPYSEREKAGIPHSDNYMVQGVLRTYTWKIEDNSTDSYLLAQNHLDYCKSALPQYANLIDYYADIINRLPKEKRELFVDCLYDKQKERFDRNAIKKFLKENRIDISKNKSYSKKLVPNGFCFCMLLGIISIVGLVILTLLIRTI